MITISTGEHKKFKRYVALLSQTGTNDPVAIVLENDFVIDIAWLRLAEGHYHGVLNNAFTANKTTCQVGFNVSGCGDDINFPISRIDASTINLDSGVMGDTSYDNFLQNVMVEIRVYQ